MTTVLKTLLRRAGFEIKRIQPDMVAAPTELRRLAMMRHQHINMVLDVGANGGQYGSLLRSSGYTGKIISFEPVSEAFKLLQQRSQRDSDWDVFQMAIGAYDGSAEIHIAGNSLSSSLLPMLEKHKQSAPESEYVSTQHISVRTLDGVVGGLLGASDRVLMKIDTQGYEHHVLQGASSVLGRVKLIECELSLAPLYDGQYLFLEMITLLGKQGFAPVHFEPGFTELQTGYCLQVDGIFADTGVRHSTV